MTREVAWSALRSHDSPSTPTLPLVCLKVSILTPIGIFIIHFQIYPSQTKILEGGTKDECWLFEALFKVVSTLFGLLTIEKSVEKPDFIICSSFQNLRLGSIKLRNFVFAIPGGESDAAWRTKNGAISHPRLNEGTCIREYSKVRLICNGH
jgi:hypothetical protein